VLVLNAAMLGMGIGCIVSSLTTRFRDLSAGVGFALQIWMYGSLIIFPLSRIAPESRWIFLLNPMVPVVDGFRFAFLGTGTVTAAHIALSFGISALTLFIGVILFNRASHNVIDTV
jgi:lipopolysaccharide transport system permease protein